KCLNFAVQIKPHQIHRLVRRFDFAYLFRRIISRLRFLDPEVIDTCGATHQQAPNGR
ncbi:unnamed protein product, partial [Brassica rapa subsp. narinosa]